MQPSQDEQQEIHSATDYRIFVLVRRRGLLSDSPKLGSRGMK